MAQVVSRFDEIEALKANIVAISFGTDYWARAWLEERNAPFPLLLDPERKSYRAYGLERSIRRSWGLNNLRYYLRAVLQGETWPGYRGDTNQLGGDFIVDGQGIVRLAHPSVDPTDRPSLDRLIAVLRQVSGDRRSQLQDS